MHHLSESFTRARMPLWPELDHSKCTTSARGFLVQVQSPHGPNFAKFCHFLIITLLLQRTCFRSACCLPQKLALHDFLQGLRSRPGACLRKHLHHACLPLARCIPRTQQTPKCWARHLHVPQPCTLEAHLCNAAAASAEARAPAPGFFTSGSEQVSLDALLEAWIGAQ